MSQTPLSQNQVESLLRTVNDADASEKCSSAPTLRIDSAHVTREEVDSVESRPMSEAVPTAEPYDFRRPAPLNRVIIDALHILGDVTATQFSRSAASLFGGDIDCQLDSIDQCSHQDFIFDLDNPSCFCVIDPKPLRGNWMVDIPSNLHFAMIDRMLGGEPFEGDLLQRAMTDIEQQLMRRVVNDFLSNVHDAWQRVANLHLEIDKVVNHPHCLSTIPKNASIARLQFSAQICSVRGQFTLAIPVETIQPLSDRLDTTHWENASSQQPTEESRRVLAKQLATSPIDVIVDLARSTINTRDLLGLAVGDVITTEQPVNQPVDLSIANVPKFKVSIGAYQQKVAVQIESPK
jgi:flagellar motor switch protein FliM